MKIGVRTAMRTGVTLGTTLALSVALATLAGLLGPISSAGATSGPAYVDGVRLTAFEARLVSRINGARQGDGRAPLTVRAGTVDVARTWTAQQASTNSVGHNPHLASDLSSHGSPNWQFIAENVGFYSTRSATSSDTAADALFTSYWNSPSHQANILDPRARVVGLGVVGRPESDGSVTYYNTMDFTDSYSTTYGATRQAAYGLRTEPRSVGSSRYVFAWFTTGSEPRAVTALTGSGLSVSAPRVDQPSSSGALRWDVRATTTSANGAALLSLRDSLDLTNTQDIVFRLAQTNPANKPLVVDVVLGEYWGAPSSVLLGHVSVNPGAGQTFRLAVPTSAREFRNVVTVQVSSASLAALSPTLSNRRATLAMNYVVFNS